ncbi:phage tail tape measure protein (plasmid) [Pseudomonas corrugata]|uniref:phage tail tape measure protein n=1 Tax=Pseudomonas corrugata TaxID=47879 RepID=UPI0022313F37|nr:phage tail tape measure protein [Pseudomonas corrugata]UZD98487.1 phage tail tape measure protein [Pseudomonas corrugata]UZD98508.1 phage tail tape measure protein [Pseudomonas corrugata]
MAESKFSLRLAATDAYSSQFGNFEKKARQLEQGIKSQRAELDKLNRTARSADGYASLTAKVEKTTTALQAARVEQTRLSREQKASAERVEKLKQEYDQAAAALKTLESATGTTAAQMRAARAETTRLQRELNSASSEVKKLDTSQDKATASLRTLTAAQRGERNELKRLQTELTAAGVDTSKLASEQKRLETSTKSANAALAAQRARLEAVSGAQSRMDDNRGKRADLRGQMVETAAMAYVASRPINQAMDMETAMADVGKVIDFAPGQREAMASANLKLASDRLIASSGMTGVDLANIEYAAGQSGIGNDKKDASGKVDQVAKQKAIMEFTRDAAIMGSAFDVSAKESGEIMAGWRASMMLTRDQTLDLADSTNYLGNNFNASSADIASVVKRYGAIGSASGLKPEQTAALSAALLNPGTEKEIAGTGFKNFLSAMTKGEAATKGQKETWEELGFDPEDLAAQMQQDAPKTIMTVLEALKAQPQEKQSALATQLFGSESIGAIQPLLLNLGEVQRAFDLVGDKSKYATSAMADGKMGSMMQEAAGVANTSRTGWNSFTASLTRLSTLIGTAMLPALNYVLGPLGSMVNYLGDAAESFPNITAALAVAAGGMTLLKGGALALKYVGLMLGQGANRGALARAKLDASTASTATQANLAVARLNATMGRLGASGGMGGGGGGKGGKGGKFSRVGPGSAVPRAPFMAPKGVGTVGKILSAAPTLATVAAESAPSALGKLAAMGRGLGTGAKVASKAALPLMLVSGGLQAADGLANGDTEQVGGAVGGMAGGMAGAWAGGATGAALGTLIFPGPGTAIGGAIGGIAGGIAGSGAGEWLGEKLGALVDKLSAPDDVAKDVVKGAAAATPMVFSPSITMTPTGDAAYDQRLTDQIMARLKGEMMPMMMANDPLAQRRGASLTDGSE